MKQYLEHSANSPASLPLLAQITTEHNPSQEWPDWFAQEQIEAWQKFLSLDAPARKDEAWRFANLKETDCSHFQKAPAVTEVASFLDESVGIEEVAAKLIFANDQLLSTDVSEKWQLPEGVIFCSLPEAAQKYPELLKNYFMKQPSRLGSEKFAALHQAQLQTGAFIYVPEGVVVEKPIELWHWVEGDHSAIFPHTLVVCAPGSSLKLLDHFRSADDTPSLICGVNDLIVEEGAHLTYVATQQWNDASTAFHLSSTEVGEKGIAKALKLNLGGRFIREESDCRLLGREARSFMFSVNNAQEHQEFDQRTLQDHLVAGATSDLLYHNALHDQARTIFSGLIKVESEAFETDAYQKVRNLLLSDEAEACSMPGLEILADRVRCSHGATSGQINQEELYYMMARGIPKRKAIELMVRGFFETVIQRLEDPFSEGYLESVLNGLK